MNSAKVSLRSCIQEVSYLLGNGVTFADDSTKDKLGEDFDLRLMDVAPVRFYFFVIDT